MADSFFGGPRLSDDRHIGLRVDQCSQPGADHLMIVDEEHLQISHG